MNSPKLHHYVPQFYLRRFAGESGKLWAWDRKLDRIFSTSPSAIAAESHFYRLTHYETMGYDGFEMEKQLSTIESEVAEITKEWLGLLQNAAPREKIRIPQTNRELVSKFLAIQFLRTRDTRDLLQAITQAETGKQLSVSELRHAHTELLWHEPVIHSLTQRFQQSVWVFARNQTVVPFVTSDNPVAFRGADHRQWLRSPFFAPGTYAVYPLWPDIVLYCYPREAPWYDKLDAFSDCLSPVELNEEMVRSENSGQVFMASRFLLSSLKDFEYERQFSVTIGTDVFSD